MTKKTSHIDYALEYLSEIKPVIDSNLNLTLNHEISKFEKLYPAEIVNIFKSYCEIVNRGGKRFRAALTISSYRMFGGVNDELAFKLGVFIELIHAYLLIIDDFVDKSEARRAGLSAHELIKKSLLKYENIDLTHYGNSFAVLAAMLGNHLAFNLLANLDTNPEIIRRLISKTNDNYEITYFGEIKDVLSSINGYTNEEDILNMLKWKTGVYSFDNPLTCGAILAGVNDEKKLKLLSDYAIPLGIAFQIKDDLLGVFGVVDEMGKSNLDDLKEGKMTLLIYYCLNHATNKQKTEIKKILGNQKIELQDLEKAKNILIECGAYDYSNSLVKKLIEDSQKILSSQKTNDWKIEEKNFLSGLAEYILIRKK